ncbi:MAG: PEGA domain-containing protein, partial [Deltaproteobacteria bacterium]|nr:PEGA domain-containing protein [Deltaproteobacteria bacterium]
SAENRFSVVLEKLPGILSLSVTPASEVAVYSDDQLIGTTPPNTMEISPGHHALKITKEKYQPFLTEITIAGEGKTQKIDAQLQPDWAIISFNSVPTGATVFIDDRQVGQTPLSFELLSGGHEVSLTKELFAGSSLDIVVTAGKPEAHRIKMQSLPARLTLSSKPAQAAVSIDKEYKGITPLTISLSSQTEHEIVLSSPGHKSTSRVLTLRPGEEQKLSLTLKQEYGTIYLTTNPPDASITINGKHYSSTQRKLSLPSQSHTVVAKAPGYKPVTRTILPRIGSSQQISIDLTPETGTVSSRSTPASTGNPGGLIKTAGGQKLLYVHPAPFTMGASRRQPGRRANERERGVIMKRSFYLSDKPVTNHQYRDFNRQHSGGAVGGYTLEGDQQPVVKISWEDAVSYLNWLSLKENLQPFYIKNGKTYIPALPLTNGYRLPTEAEWAFSARKLNSPKSMRFPWNGVFPPRTVTGNYADESARTFLPTIINGYRDAFPVSSPVGSFPPNPGGFFDMGGNIGEWCHDYYSANTSSLQSQPDPLGPSSGTHRVIRGSSWRDASITELRLSYRAYHRESRDNVGFRVARYP